MGSTFHVQIAGYSNRTIGWQRCYQGGELDTPAVLCQKPAGKKINVLLKR